MLFVPIWDHNPIKVIPFQIVTLALVIINIVVYFVFQTGVWVPTSQEAVLSFALIPTELINEGFLGKTGFEVFPEPVAVPERLTLISYMFLHGNFMHLLGNMLFLWVFGDNVEDAMGHLRFLLFYLMCGVFAGLAHVFASPGSEQPLIGASGAVSGVIAAYLMLHPNVRIWVLAFPVIPISITAGLALGIWIVLQVVNLVFSGDSHTAWWAHIGGLVAGALLVLFMRRPGVPLFDREPDT